ncbi:hypothetical protein [Lacticaseibacillus paracasei]|uniref:hypothetical protein n=1 Tax=Lacticaseibacillus paracasei TaxID=1597 RepID=UPI0021A584A7|nr:hypothetical protein [Lacticaseibacillus paracasei]MCT4384166.1 hypothetical protein [Lacticaseibacillus paracasei]
MQNWGVVIVLYHPEMAKLKRTIVTTLKNTPYLALVNNGEPLADLGDSVVELGENKGIAYAQNIGVETLQKQSKLDGVFFLDQDSEIEENFFSRMLLEWDRLTLTHPRLAMLSPVIRRRTETGNYSILILENDRLIKASVDSSKQTIVENTLPISSGVLVSVSAFMAVDGLASKWFIDWVDFDLDLKLLMQGYSIVTTNATSIIHEIGTPDRRNFFGKQIAVTNYVLFREYYTARNSMYLMRKFGATSKGISKYCWGQVSRRFLMLLYEPKKFRRFATLVGGLIVGLTTSYH